MRAEPKKIWHSRVCGGCGVCITTLEFSLQKVLSGKATIMLIVSSENFRPMIRYPGSRFQNEILSGLVAALALLLTVVLLHAVQIVLKILFAPLPPVLTVIPPVPVVAFRRPVVVPVPMPFFPTAVISAVSAETGPATENELCQKTDTDCFPECYYWKPEQPGHQPVPEKHGEGPNDK